MMMNVLGIILRVALFRLFRDGGCRSVILGGTKHSSPPLSLSLPFPQGGVVPCVGVR